MAWNEPGNKNKDPWKNSGGKNQGPPDLDDLFKNLGNKFGGVFGKKSPSGSSFSSLGVGLVLIIAIVVWSFSGFYTVKEAERGVVLRFGQFYQLVEPGLRWKPTFIDRVIPVDVQTTRDLPSSGFMLTQDENMVNVEMQIQYRVVNARNYLFSVTNADDSLGQSLESAIRYVVGHSVMDDVLTSGRELVRQQVWESLEQIIEPYNLGLIIVDVNFKDARPPEQVKDAFDDAIAAQEDEIRFIREAEAYERGLEPRARGTVKRLEQEAKAYKEQVVLAAQGEVAKFNQILPEYKTSPEVMRQRLYIAAMENVYGNTSKVMVDVEGGNNMMYLPLDKIMQQHSTQIPASMQMRQENSNQLTPENSNSSTVNSSQRGDRFDNRGRN